MYFWLHDIEGDKEGYWQEYLNKVLPALERSGDYNHADPDPVTSPQPKTKKQIESAQDVDKYLTVLREQIIKELDEETVVNIEF